MGPVSPIGSEEAGSSLLLLQLRAGLLERQLDRMSVTESLGTSTGQELAAVRAWASASGPPLSEDGLWVLYIGKDLCAVDELQQQLGATIKVTAAEWNNGQVVLVSRAPNVVVIEATEVQASLADCFRQIRETWPGVPVVAILPANAAVETPTAFLEAEQVVFDDRLQLLGWAVRKALQAYLVENERRQADQALGALAQLLTELVRSAPVPIVVCDRELRVTMWNPAAERVLEWRASEAAGKTIGELFGEGSELERLLNEARQRASPVEAEFSYQRNDGQRLELRLCCAPLLDSSGAVENLAAVLVDVTELKLVIRAYRETNERFFSAFQSAPTGMMLAGLDGQILRANPALCRMLGYEEQRLRQVRLTDLIHPDDRTQAQLSIETAPARTELRLVHAHGDTVYCDWHVSTVCDESNQPQYAIIQVVDLTERKRAEEQIRRYASELERSNRELQQFAYAASHDLQEPLRMVRGFLELLERRYGDQLDQTARQYIQFAVDGAARMQALIRGLLDYSRVQTHAQPLRPVSLEKVLAQALANLHASLVEAHGEVIHEPLPTVKGDEHQLVQVFQNLIGNAIKFRSERTPRVIIRANDRGHEWEISVQDNGVGFDPAQAGRLFQMFQRLHPRSKYPGTGIGLALCHRIIERHGGRIWAESRPGQGATFYFTLPKEPNVS